MQSQTSTPILISKTINGSQSPRMQVTSIHSTSSLELLNVHTHLERMEDAISARQCSSDMFPKATCQNRIVTTLNVSEQVKQPIVSPLELRTEEVLALSDEEVAPPKLKRQLSFHNQAQMDESIITPNKVPVYVNPSSTKVNPRYNKLWKKNPSPVPLTLLFDDCVTPTSVSHQREQRRESSLKQVSSSPLKTITPELLNEKDEEESSGLNIRKKSPRSSTIVDKAVKHLDRIAQEPSTKRKLAQEAAAKKRSIKRLKK